MVKHLIHIDENDDLSNLDAETLMSIVIGVAAETGKFDDDDLAELGRSILAYPQWLRVYFAEQSRDSYFARHPEWNNINVVIYKETDVAEIEEAVKGETILVPSDKFSQTGQMYQVTVVEGEALNCDCKGFEFTGKCKHIDRYNQRRATEKTQDYYESR